MSSSTRTIASTVDATVDAADAPPLEFAHDIADITNLNDDLRRTTLSRTIARDIRAQPDHARSIYGIYGSWGAGKSYLISQVINALFAGNANAQTKIIVARFYTWRYELSGTLAPGLVRTLETIESQYVGTGQNPSLTRSTDYKRIARELLPVVSDLLQLGTAFTPVGQALVPAIQNVSSRWEHILKREKDAQYGDVDRIQGLMEKLVSAILQAARDGEAGNRKKGERPGNWRLVIAVDDLDRCSPQNMVQMFEWMKVHLRAPDCTYLVALDHEAAARAIRGHYHDYLSEEQDLAYGFRYLEKLVDSEYELELAAHVEEMAIHRVFESSRFKRVSEVTANTIGGDFPGVRFMDLLLSMRSLRIPRTMLKIVDKYRRALDVLQSHEATTLRNQLPDGYAFWVLFLTAMYFRLEPEVLGDFIEGRGMIFSLMSGNPYDEEKFRDAHEPLLEFYTYARDFGRSVGTSLQTPGPETLSKLATIVRETTLPADEIDR